MNVLGSVFLGDAARNRVFSSSPSSPPASPMHQMYPRGNAPPIDPVLSLELRIRWLEVLLFGVKQDQATLKKETINNAKNNNKGSTTAASVPTKSKEEKEALVLRAEELKKKLDVIVDSNDGLRKFMDRYDRHAQILTPAFALSGASTPPSFSSMSSEELDALLAEMEPEIRAADRDLREIDILEKRGVLSAGKLADYEGLVPRLETLKKEHEEDLATAADLERRIGNVLRQYTTRIDTLSELFVEWNDVLLVAEDKVARLEREKAEKVRLGYSE